MAAKKPETINGYLKNYPGDVRKKMQQIRLIMAKVLPDAKQGIKYAIPTFTLNSRHFSFAAYKHHIGVYPIPNTDATTKKRLAPYKAEKSTLQFPLNKPLPLALIRKVALARAKDMRASKKRG